MANEKETTTDLKVTSLEEIREQAKADIITIPGFKPNTTINVKVQALDMTELLLQHNVSNPLLDLVDKKAREGMDEEELKAAVMKKMGGMDDGDAQKRTDTIKKLSPLLKVVCQEVLVQPTFKQFENIRPLTVTQRLAIFNHVIKGVKEKEPFCDQ